MSERSAKQQKPAQTTDVSTQQPQAQDEFLQPEHAGDLAKQIGSTADTPPLTPNHVQQIMHLQSVIGNHAVQRMLHQGDTTPQRRTMHIPQIGLQPDPSDHRYLIHNYQNASLSQARLPIQREVKTPGRDLLDAGWRDVNKIGMVYKDEGANLRDKPASETEGSVILQNLPQNTKVLILKHKPAPDKWYAVRVMGGAFDGQSGYVADWLVRDDLPDPQAQIYRVQQGDQLGKLVQNHPQYKDYPIQLGDDARSLVMAVYMANRDNGGVTLNPKRADNPWYEDAWDWGMGLLDDYRDELGPIYEMAELKAGALIWLPGPTYIAALKDSGLIPERPEWKNVAITLVKGIGGFTVGIVEGFIGAIVDLVVGVIELGKSIIDAIISLFTGAALESAQEMYDFFSEIVQNPAMLRELAQQLIATLVSSIASSIESFLAKWNAPNPYDSWNFRGKVVGYILAEILMLYFSGGVSAAKWLPKLGKLGRILLKVLDKIEDGMDKIPGLKRRKGDRDRNDDSGESGDRLAALAKARLIAEAHDSSDSPIPVVLGALNVLKTQHKGVKGFNAEPTSPGHYRIIMRAVVDPDYTPGADGGQPVPKKAPPQRVINDLRDFAGADYKFGPNSFKLERSGMKHILERHHPRYWDGSIKDKQSFFDANMSIDDVQDAIEAVLKQNRDFLARPSSGSLYRQITGTYNGKKYILGLNRNRIGQFYPPAD